MHKTVLLNEVIDGLEIKKSDIVFDGTLGAGGHSLKACEKLGTEGILIATDLDADAIAIAKDRLSKCDVKKFLIQDSFRNIDTVLESIDIKSIDKIILDLGFSSVQLEDSGRGISFKKDEPLLMTLGDSPKEENLTAMEIVNTWEEENIADIIYGYGEEKFSRRIAKAITEHRREAKIETTTQLVEIIKHAIPAKLRHGKIHPATKTFQALRIAVNDELGALKEVLAKSAGLLNENGRMAIISFHSLEDRIVKNTFKEFEKTGKFKIITKKPISPNEEELKENRRARSAKLRIIEKK